MRTWDDVWTQLGCYCSCLPSLRFKLRFKFITDLIDCRRIWGLTNDVPSTSLAVGITCDTQSPSPPCFPFRLDGAIPLFRAGAHWHQCEMVHWWRGLLFWFGRCNRRCYCRDFHYWLEYESGTFFGCRRSLYCYCCCYVSLKFPKKEVYLRRKGHVHDEESRLDRLLLQKCLEGILAINVVLAIRNPAV